MKAKNMELVVYIVGDQGSLDQMVAGATKANNSIRIAGIFIDTCFLYAIKQQSMYSTEITFLDNA